MLLEFPNSRIPEFPNLGLEVGRERKRERERERRKEKARRERETERERERERGRVNSATSLHDVLHITLPRHTVSVSSANKPCSETESERECESESSLCNGSFLSGGEQSKGGTIAASVGGTLLHL